MSWRALAIAIAALAIGCGEGEPPASDQPARKAVVVGTVPVTREEIVEPVLGTGTIAAHKTTDVGPRVDGIIEEIFVRVGDRVEEGSPLFRTRDVDYRIRLKQARYAAQLARAESRKAIRDHERIARLFESGVASDEQIDAARTAREIAEARLGAAETALERARQDLEDTLVRAPYDGVITRQYAYEGTMMRTMMSANAVVVQIMKTDIVAAIIQIPEVHLPRIRLGTPGTVRIDGLDREYPSEVTILNDRVDNASRSIEVRLAIRNPDLAIKPGLFAKARLLPEKRSATLLDRRAVLGAPGSRYVFVPLDGKAIRRPVRVRDLDASRVEVLEGLSPGDRVLVGVGLSRVVDGAPVRVEGPDVAL